VEDRIIVVDSRPGSGKTQASIQIINELPDDVKVVYITPYLSEVTRVLNSCPNKKFVQPDVRKGRGSKLNHLVYLVANGKNIVSTHALFSNISDELISVLRSNNYVLFLDEVFQTVERYDIVDGRMNNERKDEITKQDVNTLIDHEIIKVEEDFKIKWLDPENKLSKYDNLKNLCDRELIYFVNGSLLLWTFPIEVFREGIFDQIFISTHRFESQLQAYYYKYFELEYIKYMAYKDENGIYKIKKGKSEIEELEWKKQIKENIFIIEDSKLNKVGCVYVPKNSSRKYKSALSKTWYDNNDSSINSIKNNLVNYFQNTAKSKANERLWTCFEDNRSKIKSTNEPIKSWLACNARATNDYANRTVLAYLVNRYVDPFYDNFFIHKNIQINQDEFALSEMMQWIWRSAIRNGEKIMIYIPSERMRSLLKKYLNNEEIEF
jgi:hypothetical protein